MATCLIGLGSNLGDRRRTLDDAVDRLAGGGIEVVARSRWQATVPVGGPPGQGFYLNGVVLGQTSLDPHAVLAVLCRIESALGRKRAVRWGPRPLDLDLLLYDELVVQTPELILPHPRMACRRFVLQPAVEVAAGLVHPTTGWTVAQLLDHLDASPPYVAIAGPAGLGKRRLAEEFARQTGARVITDPGARRRRRPRDPSGDTLATELEFLDRRLGVLDRRLPDWSRLAVSDFWLDQVLVDARCRLEPKRLAAFEERFGEARRRAVCPRFAVVVDPGPAAAGAPVGHRGPDVEIEPGFSERFRRELLQAAVTAGHGPVLVVPAGDGEQAVSEVLAAWEATLRSPDAGGAIDPRSFR